MKQKQAGFREESEELERWLADMKVKMLEKEVPRDVADVEALFKKHQELRNTIDSNNDK